MINAGMPAHIVQRYLKHTSPEMTMHYAQLFDSTMKEAFAKFQGKLIDIAGKVVTTGQDVDLPIDLKWLKQNILAQALPNGCCVLPIQQGDCPHANACLTCGHFRTTRQFLHQHKQQLEETKRLLSVEEQNGWLRQAEVSRKVEQNLHTIIQALEEQ